MFSSSCYDLNVLIIIFNRRSYPMLRSPLRPLAFHFYSLPGYNVVALTRREVTVQAAFPDLALVDTGRVTVRVRAILLFFPSRYGDNGMMKCSSSSDLTIVFFFFFSFNFGRTTHAHARTRTHTMCYAGRKPC